LENLAGQLWEARRLGRTIDASSCELPKTQDEAYAVQDAVVKLSGLQRRGYKVGSTSAEAQRFLDTDEPGASPLPPGNALRLSPVGTSSARCLGRDYGTMRAPLPPTPATDYAFFSRIRLK
jgi:hypothetical protein